MSFGVLALTRHWHVVRSRGLDPAPLKVVVPEGWPLIVDVDEVDRPIGDDFSALNRLAVMIKEPSSCTTVTEDVGDQNHQNLSISTLTQDVSLPPLLPHVIRHICDGGWGGLPIEARVASQWSLSAMILRRGDEIEQKSTGNEDKL